MADTFTWRPDKEPTGTTSFRNKSARFGDGYEQVAKDGINNKTQSWPLTFTGDKARAKEIEAFLDKQAGAAAFKWTEPMCEELLFRCKTYQLRNVSASVWTVSATFEQAFHP
ncbi:phage tail protein [Pseudomonas viridiflava]|uniref:phage tail protein n=1 Tax=Pseudomonas viridiflava TaxID=33069 RepID=UPI000F053B56|nr:phage tail protein [Pseudomonas viridiflava]